MTYNSRHTEIASNVQMVVKTNSYPTVCKAKHQTIKEKRLFHRPHIFITGCIFIYNIFSFRIQKCGTFIVSLADGRSVGREGLCILAWWFGVLALAIHNKSSRGAFGKMNEHNNNNNNSTCTAISKNRKQKNKKYNETKVNKVLLYYLLLCVYETRDEIHSHHIQFKNS